MSEPMVQPVIIAGMSKTVANYDYAMSELEALVEANNMHAELRIDQSLEKPNPATYFGKGKVVEIKEMAEAEDLNVMVVNADLTPSQVRNLETETGLQIIDRTGLILEIFGNRARSKEAKLQVKIAQLQYQLPRLRTSIANRLDQQAGAAAGGGGGFTNRGSGETQLELNRRTIQDRISHAKHELKELNKDAEVRRSAREKAGLPNVALVGYTNAGKSTTMNGLVKLFGKGEDKQVFEKNMLFATLDTSIRQLTFPDNKQLLLSDTVGFVSNLPHNLINAFRSTLAEAASADLLIQVIDYADPHYKEMMATTEETLKAIGVHDVPMLYAYNKADLTEANYPNQQDDQLIYAARDEASIQALTKMIKAKVFKDFVTTTLLIPFNDGDVVAYLNDHANILKTDYLADGTQLTVELNTVDAQRYAKYAVTPA
ncbi:GTPase HflX [Lactiplantibacillus mudanjiangensis]|uniref:GTPase HflX n=1 Tax=Lactiplantibacillus mudanjiangensis TaxID=1296538 RepID=A0A660E4Q8_9LACO|nr:GTPase HflX [Lactiplantibacillus mudanjiangensis]VDG17812.1 GTPase [Lactobacillus plantarum JDM1] [Lactiplantibacillus mudanjiangensis]VDG25484.1 GTPase [Lactobacillus plantarum JDM1] [Lactiplantibacillus mudanjiangensis]VDG27928.1 GTPase [Lactobacillus plantarum JDM1] [Lactiplantibacillus mudanjiangensis]VDG32490.1 GTPase [Lactobacillus plantarum JDM1] [Lactiplantibacillus mudanjiangensis]